MYLLYWVSSMNVQVSVCIYNIHLLYVKVYYKKVYR